MALALVATFGLTDVVRFGPRPVAVQVNQANVDAALKLSRGLSDHTAETVQLAKVELSFWQPSLPAGDSGKGVTWDFKDKEVPPLYGAGGPAVTDARQGGIGDCYFHAELLSMVLRNPSLVTSSIKSNPGRTFTVTFYEKGKPVPITVTADLPVKGSAHAYGGDRNGIWIGIYEKAYAELKGGYGAIESTDNPAAWKWTGTAFPSLTGHAEERKGKLALAPDWLADVFPIGSPPALAELAQWKKQGHLVTVSTYSTGDKTGEYKNRFPPTVTVLDDAQPGAQPGAKADAVVASHEYFVESVDVAGGTVTLLNPWGQGATAPFKIRVKAADYQKYFMDGAHAQA